MPVVNPSMLNSSYSKSPSYENLRTHVPIATPWTPGWGYLVKRVLAYSIDVLANAAFFILVISQTVWRGNFSPSILLDPHVAVVAGIFFSLLNWTILTLEEMMFGTSLGKKVFGLTLRGSAIAIFLRALFFIPSSLFFGVGLFWSLIDSRKACWHDRMLEIQPTETR